MGKKKAVLAARLSDDDTLPPQLMMFVVYRPNTGISQSNQSLSKLESYYYKTTPEKAKKHWIYQYNQSSEECEYVTVVFLF